MADLYYVDIGEGTPIVVVHGGPDFDHHYLRPELDRLADSFRLVYYDQRGRGRSAGEVRPEEVSIGSEVDDLERLRRHLRLERVAVLGHSWGGLLALEYAIRHPDRVSHLVLMNTAPVSSRDFDRLRQELRRRRSGDETERMAQIRSSADYQRGSLDAEADYYRIHFKPAVRRPEDLDRIVGRLRSHFTEAGVRKARAIEQRLYDETFLSGGYDLIPKLTELDLPTLVLHGEQDFIPVELATPIATAIPGARLAVLPACGHFAYLEWPDLVHKQVAALLRPA
jgi:proline iminopeptidase